MTNPDLNPIEREALVEFLKKLTPIRTEPLATLVAEEWAGKFYEEFYPEKPKDEMASSLYAQFSAEAADNIQSILFDQSGWSSEHYSREFHKFRSTAEDMADRLFNEPVWSLLGFAIEGLEAAANEQ